MNSAYWIIGGSALVIAFWILLCRLVSRGGWRAVAAKHRALSTPFGQRIGGVSGSFPRGRYSGALAVWVAPDGFFIRPLIVFRAFHPALFIPWSCVASVSENKALFRTSTTVRCNVDATSFVLQLPGARRAVFGSHVPQNACHPPEPPRRGVH
jgi:hypothetical protein